MRFCELCGERISPEAMLIDYCKDCGDKAEKFVSNEWKESGGK
jgi:hypothetical protein